MAPSKFRRILMPYFGNSLKGSVKSIAFFDVIIGIMSIVALIMYIVKDVWIPKRGHILNITLSKANLDLQVGETPESALDKRALERLLYATYYFAYYVSNIFLSRVLFKAAHKRSLKCCWTVLCINVPMTIVFTLLFTSQWYWDPVKLEHQYPLEKAYLPAMVIYKVYSFMVTAAFIEELIECGVLLNQALRCLSDTEIEEFIKGNNPSSLENTVNWNSRGTIYGRPYNEQFEISLDSLDIDEEHPLGSGAFGIVYRARYINKATSTCQTVAVKILKSDTEVGYFKSVLTELKIMTNVGSHENIVYLVGACTADIRERKVLIVEEFCPYGNMRTYLQSRRGLFINQILEDKIENTLLHGSGDTTENTDDMITTMDLVKWSFQTSRGMEYLSSKKIVHGDLAARNVMLSRNKIVKIGDFGLSRQLYQCSTFVKTDNELLPWGWLAYEALSDLKFSVASDVWAFGVTIWEFFSLAHVPYPGLSLSQDFITDLKNGLRMQCPQYSTTQIHKIMLDCWDIAPTKRPSFSVLCSHFEKMQKNVKSGYVTIHVSNSDDN